MAFNFSIIFVKKWMEKISKLNEYIKNILKNTLYKNKSCNVHWKQKIVHVFSSCDAKAGPKSKM